MAHLSERFGEVESGMFMCIINEMNAKTQLLFNQNHTIADEFNLSESIMEGKAKLHHRHIAPSNTPSSDLQWFSSIPNTRRSTAVKV